MNAPEKSHCAECGSELPPGLPRGLCPHCALQAAAGPTEPANLALPTAQPGERIGRYKLLQQIGEGGCGVVFMAEQEEPIRRKVALKVIKLGMDTKSVIARFEAERQALALMDHQNIAKVFDAGATDTGRPYFVMELVRGVRITDYCDQHNLTTTARLDLFTQVCHAIQHAHQKGIIHRDIKPSNILVTLHDGVPVPKVIDFGIAKATSDQRLTDKTLFTAFEQFMGTPAYMSPEQAEMSGLDIDTRSDIYSLGVLLYELLTGKTPFDGKELLAAGLDAMRRTIREQEPAKPSTRLSMMLEADRTEIAKHRQTEPAKLTTLLRGDLDWIVMTALEKDRARRYESAGAFVDDISRFLRTEPVQAHPPTPAYRLRKLIKRHKLVVTASGIVSVALWIALAVSTYSFIKKRDADYYLNRKFGEIEHSWLSDALQRQKERDAERLRSEKLMSELRTQQHNRLVVDQYFEEWAGRANTAIAEELMESNLVVYQGLEIIRGPEEYNRRMTNLHASLTNIWLSHTILAQESQTIVVGWMLKAESREPHYPKVTAHRGVLASGISIFRITGGKIQTITTKKEQYDPSRKTTDVFFTFP